MSGYKKNINSIYNTFFSDILVFIQLMKIYP